MKLSRTLSMLVIMVAFAAVAPRAALACTGGRNLIGYYGVLIAGNSLQSNAGGKYLSGGINGTFSNTSVSGTYDTNADGTISIAWNLSDGSATQTYIVGVSASDKEAVGIETDGSSTATILLEPQRVNTPAYTNASLTGQFAVVCSGLGESKADLNWVNFDGNGNLSGQNPFNVNGWIGDAPYTGTYTVSPDGTFQGVLQGNYDAYSFTGVIEDKFLQVQYTYYESGSGEIVACSGKK
jgi:hypothetical protein